MKAESWSDSRVRYLLEGILVGVFLGYALTRIAFKLGWLAL